MNLSWSWWCKHFHLVYLFSSIHFLSSTLASVSVAGDDPTEEPEESFNVSSTEHSPSSSTTEKELWKDFINKTEVSFSAFNLSLPLKEDFSSTRREIDTTNENGRNYQSQARALFPASGNLFSWRTAGWMLKKGLRMFRESLVEGTKVAHMFKEDIDEGMSSIMRQNRGVKVDSKGNQQNDNSATNSFFDSQMLREGVLGGILRFMGVNSKQMGVIALNMLIILAEWITSSMIGGNEVAGATSRMIKSNLLQWANTGHNSQVEKILSQAKSHSLPEKLIDSLSEKTGNSTACVQLLICKMSPVIWGLQDTVKEQLHNYGWVEETGWKTAPKSSSTISSTQNNSNVENEEEIFEPRGILETSQYLVDKFLGNLPETERIIDFGDRCEVKFPQCHLLKFGSKK